MLVACTGSAPSEPVATAKWTYPPPPAAFAVGAVSGRIGRSQAPQKVARLGIEGAAEAPLRLVTPWTVPGKGPARAVLYGRAGEHAAVELVDVDAGKLMWRDAVTCAGPVVGVTERTIVCTDASGLRAIGIDGKPKWRSDQTFLAMTDDRVVAAGVGEAVVLDAASGDELARVKLPPKIASEGVIASCGDAGRELFVFGQDSRLARIAEGKGGPAVVWAQAVGAVSGIEACEGPTVLARVTGTESISLVALARETGKVTGRVDGVVGWWPARDGSERIEISTASGVASWPRDLSGPPVPLALPALGELIARRGEQRLVRADQRAAILLDRTGVRAFVPLAEQGAVLGDRAVVAASWTGSAGFTVRRFAIPDREVRAPRLHTRRPPLGVPAELRDLPAVAPLDESHAFAHATRAAAGLGAIAVAGTSVYATAADDDRVALARADLQRSAFAWVREDGCAGAPVAGVAIAEDIVVCAGHAKGRASVRATALDGTPRWDAAIDEVDAVTAAGDTVLAFWGDRARVLAASDGRVLAELASDDGDLMRATALVVDRATVVVTYERGRLLARLPAARMLPAWSLEVAGIVRALSPSGDGILVELDDGDAFRVDARTGAATALPGLDLAWYALGSDVIAADAAGEPVPPDKMPVAPVSIKKPVPRYDVQENEPPIAVPWIAPPAGPAAWQLTLYELGGGLRTRNDYALAAPVAPVLARGPAESPIVATYGPGAHEALVVEPHHGDPVRRVALPDDARPFATVVDGKPIAGAVLPNPLRVVLF